MNKIDLKDILQENLADDNQDYLSILGDEKEMLNDHTDIPDTLPILPLRNTVLFPGVIIPINIGREKSLKLIRYVYKSSVPFGVIAQRDTNTENPKLEDLYTIGTVATVLKILECRMEPQRLSYKVKRDSNSMTSCMMNPTTWERSLSSKRIQSRRMTKSIMPSERL